MRNAVSAFLLASCAVVLAAITAFAIPARAYAQASAGRAYDVAGVRIHMNPDEALAALQQKYGVMPNYNESTSDNVTWFRVNDRDGCVVGSHVTCDDVLAHCILCKPHISIEQLFYSRPNFSIDIRLISTSGDDRKDKEEVRSVTFRVKNFQDPRDSAFFTQSMLQPLAQRYGPPKVRIHDIRKWCLRTVRTASQNGWIQDCDPAMPVLTLSRGDAFRGEAPFIELDDDGLVQRIQERDREQSTPRPKADF